MNNEKVLVETRNLKKHFLVSRGLSKKSFKYLKAVDDISIQIHEGEIFGLVGESGCGKSTFGRTILRLHPITAGEVYYDGQAIHDCSKVQMREYRKKMQMVFQDPYASLNPRMTIYESVKAPLDVFNTGSKEERNRKVREMMDYVGLSSGQGLKYPHEMSGGQRQRAVIARTLILEPQFIVCDEPVSALDVSIRSQVLNLMKKMQRELNLSYLFISHDLSVVRYLCNTVAVMYLGQIVEIADKTNLFEDPRHPYTKALLSAIPIPDARVKRNRIILEGDVPSPLNPPSGCRFHNRCPYATEQCSMEMPKLRTINDYHQVACHLE
nr:dipeptide ABC transporter ATP-binding protein [Lachnospiraceae bacterium]